MHRKGPLGRAVLALGVFAAACSPSPSSPEGSDTGAPPTTITTTSPPTTLAPTTTLAATTTAVPTTTTAVEGMVARELDLGACFDARLREDRPPYANAQRVASVDCEQDHQFELFAAVLHSGEETAPFPGDRALLVFGSPECKDRLTEFVGISWFDSGYDSLTMWPDGPTWDAGDRTILCSLSRLDGEKMAGSARGSGPIVPQDHVSLFRFEVGDCFDDSSWVIFGLPKPCEEPHDNEVFASVEYPRGPDAPHPGEDVLFQYGSVACIEAFAPFTGEDYETSPLDVLPIIPIDWEEGGRTIRCFLWDLSGGKLEGSMAASTET